jgi:hypothetical protein
MASFDGKILIEKLSDNFQVDFNLKIEQLSGEFATAYEVRDVQVSQNDKPKYALVFKNDFPVDLEKVFRLKDNSTEVMGYIFEVGKVINPQSQKEQLAVILQRPRGKKLSEILAEKGPLDESFLFTTIFDKVFSSIGILHSFGFIHGAINLDNIYYNGVESKVFLKESISEYPGYSQKQVYETYERMVCHKAAKDTLQFDADYYAAGVALIGCLFGEEPLSGLGEDEVVQEKFTRGSYDSIFLKLRSKRRVIAVSGRGENLIKGLMHDKMRDRWGDSEVRAWFRRESGQAILSKLHRQSALTYEFDGVEYTSAKYLALNIHKNWVYAKKYVKLNDMARWLNLIAKDPSIEKKLFSIARVGSEIIFPDDKLARIIFTLDPDGPIRYKNTALTVKGVGNYLSYILSISDEAALQEFNEILDNGLLDGWINQQSEQAAYKYSNLGWTPRKIRIYSKKQSLGFGLSRCLYELSPFMPCQSPMVGNNYVVSVPALLKALNSLRLNFKENEPIDEHVAAFICSDLDIEDSIRIKQLSNFPYLNKLREIETTALLAMAQAKYDVVGLNNLSAWVRERLNVVIDKINSAVIKRNMQEKLDDIVKLGDVNRLFTSAIDPNFINKDIFGFKTARKQYKILNFERGKLKSQRNLDKMAYRMGLKISVLTAYIMCAIAVSAIVLMNMK